MKPSSAMALVSSMPGAAMPAFLSACSALVMASPFLSQPLTRVADHDAGAGLVQQIVHHTGLLVFRPRSSRLFIVQFVLSSLLNLSIKLSNAQMAP